MDPKTAIKQLHIQPYAIPQNIRSHFEDNAITAKCLSLQNYEPTVPWARMQGSANGLFLSTLNNENTIPHWITLRTKQRRNLPTAPTPGVEVSTTTKPDLITLIHLGGSGVCSFHNTLHGGMISTLFDEVFFATLNHVMYTHPADVDNPTRFSTMQLDVKYRRSVRVPGIVVVRAWCLAIAGRKCWTYAELLQESGDDQSRASSTDAGGADVMERLHVAATCEAFWLRSGGMKL
ncbi:unnamed protein product [Zymoseptoria tritici ST99CH_3D7]|uniref:Thioesterase domain-containing protein n=1 Tax=Zymoseptoria tritici (strain ST99CH_3D7) TaxID=1276538 RepID=A0A1X7RPZ6_ZYMT9|nr:unnamed protein product [Zymoseptoria tritici ST99CH_3D7]